jgi:hypothetical protein
MRQRKSTLKPEQNLWLLGHEMAQKDENHENP